MILSFRYCVCLGVRIYQVSGVNRRCQILRKHIKDSSEIVKEDTVSLLIKTHEKFTFDHSSISILYKKGRNR